MPYNSTWNQDVNQTCEEIQLSKSPLLLQAGKLGKCAGEWDSKHADGSMVPGQSQGGRSHAFPSAQ